MLSYQQNANRTSMFAILVKHTKNQVALDYGNQNASNQNASNQNASNQNASNQNASNQNASGKQGYPVSYNDSSSRTHVLKHRHVLKKNDLKSNSASNDNYVANTYNQIRERVKLLRRAGSAAPRKVGAIKNLYQ